MTTFDRRRFLRVASASMATAALGVSGCARTSSKEERETQSESQHLLRWWWDQFQPLKALQEKTFRGFESSHRGVRVVEYTVYNRCLVVSKREHALSIRQPRLAVRQSRSYQHQWCRAGLTFHGLLR